MSCRVLCTHDSYLIKISRLPGCQGSFWLLDEPDPVSKSKRVDERWVTHLFLAHIRKYTLLLLLAMQNNRLMTSHRASCNQTLCKTNISMSTVSNANSSTPSTWSQFQLSNEMFTPVSDNSLHLLRNIKYHQLYTYQHMIVFSISLSIVEL